MFTVLNFDHHAELWSHLKFKVPEEIADMSDSEYTIRCTFPHFQVYSTDKKSFKNISECFASIKLQGLSSIWRR